MIYVITGYLGAGKSLIASQKLIDYAAQGRKVACNYPIDFLPICHDKNSNLSKASPVILPSIPHSRHLLQLGHGGTHEENAGALVLDEAAQFLNSRTWNGEDRQQLINWLLHARKRYWDVFLIIQHESQLDKQIRVSLAEYVVTVRRTDRMKIPFLPIKMPRLHIAVVRYGLDKNSYVADRWFTRGNEPMKIYNSYQIFNTDDKQEIVVVQPAANRLKKPTHINLIPIITAIPKIIIYYIVYLLSPTSLPILKRKPLNQLPININTKNKKSL